MAGEVFVDATGTITCVAASCAERAGLLRRDPDRLRERRRLAGVRQRARPHGLRLHAARTTARDDALAAPQRVAHRRRRGDAADCPTRRARPTRTTLAAIELRFVMSGVTVVVGLGRQPGPRAQPRRVQGPDVAPGAHRQDGVLRHVPARRRERHHPHERLRLPAHRHAERRFRGRRLRAPLRRGHQPGRRERDRRAPPPRRSAWSPRRRRSSTPSGRTRRTSRQSRGAGAKVIWAPRSNISLYGNTTPVTEMKYAGVTIALGTDWLPSGSMNMLRELACADELNSKYFGERVRRPGPLRDGDDQRAPRRWVRQPDRHPRGRACRRDVAVFADERRARTGSVPSTPRRGRARSCCAGARRSTATRCSCRPRGGHGVRRRSTCAGSTRRCASTCPSVTLADIQTAASRSTRSSSAAGQTPTGEPTCVPYRDTYPNGTSATDQDGDGVPDTNDDCPTVFNPPRSMDDDDAVGRRRRRLRRRVRHEPLDPMGP